MPRTYQRNWLRLAQRLGERLAGTGPLPPVPPFPDDCCQELLPLVRRLEWTVARDWRQATVVARDDLTSAARDVISRLQSWIDSVPQPTPPARHGASAHELYHDLVALNAEFGELEYDPDDQTLAVTTGPIVLEGVNLGRFQIVLHTDRLRIRTPYDVVALDPNPAAVRPETTHPHVDHERLCEGEGATSIRRALEQGRLFDFFLLVRQILTTYNSGSPYVELSAWEGRVCSDCAASTSEDDLSTCGGCNDVLCSDCGMSCSDCGTIRCAACGERCRDCGESYCSGCLSACIACDSMFCDGCLRNGHCADCRATPEEPHEPNDERAADPANPIPGPPETIDEPAAEESDLAIDPLCLGEAPLPA